MSYIRYIALFVFLVFPTFLFAQEVEDQNVESTKDELVSDPIEPFNRGMFWFNDNLDLYIAEPVARGYDYVLPQSVQNGVTNFFRNLRFPIQVVSNLLQFEFSEAADDTGRFLVNSTAGVLGIFDVYGGDYTPQDLGTAMGYWGVGPGPYLVVPLLGPSNLRDFVGDIGGFFLDPLFWFYQSSALNPDEDFLVSGSLYALKYVNIRARLLEITDDMRETSLDYYLTQQSSYMQYRNGLIRGMDTPTDEDWFEDDYDDDFFEDLDQSPAASE